MAANKLFLGVSVIILLGRVSIVSADDKLYPSTAVGIDHATEDKKPSTDRMLSLLSQHGLRHPPSLAPTHCCF